jgi:hypothetical protein
MSWAIGFDSWWYRDIGYGVPAECDHPQCHEQIDRGLAHVCGGEPYGGEHGCGLYFCGEHLSGEQCSRCRHHKKPFTPKPDVDEWIAHKLTHDSWSQWRAENQAEVEAMKARKP